MHHTIGSECRHHIGTPAGRVAAAVAAVLASGGSTIAAEETGARIEEIVVTAQKREQNLQDVGISVTAFGGDRLADLGFGNATDIIKQTPGLAILSSSASNTNVNIRGVSQNDFADHLEGPVAVYADEGYLGAAGTINGQMYDIERVEVLRGPQGTLFGRNATGGLLHYVSRGPSDTFEAQSRIDVGERGLFQFEAGVGGPLSDRVRARLAIAGVQDDGYVDNLRGENPANHSNYSARLQFAFDLGDSTELRLMVNGTTTDGERGLAGSAVPAVADANGQGRALGRSEIGSWPNIILGGTVPGSCAGCDVLGYRPPADEFKREYSDLGEFNKDLYHGQIKLTSTLGPANMTSISDYLSLDKDMIDQDVDAGPSQFFRYSTFQDYRQFSQELRLDGESGPLKWLVGAFYLDIQGDYSTAVVFDASRYVGAPVCNITPGFGCPTPIPGVVGRNFNEYSLDTSSYSAFTQLEYALTDAVSLIGGLRYTKDQKEVDYLWSTTAFPFPTPTLYNPATDPTADRSFENIAAKVGLDWRPSDDTLVYLSYSRGHKGGSWALPSFPPPITQAAFPLFPHKQEVLTDYEVGVKNDLWDGKARFNIGAFYYDYDNYQAFSLAGLAQSILNKDAKAWGGEAELVLLPVRGLELSLGVASTNSEVYDMQYPTGAGYTARLPFDASLSLNGFVRYEWDALGGVLAAQGSFTYAGGYYFAVANEPFTYEDRYFTADARLAYTSGSGKWDVAVWAKNLTDTEYRTFAIDISALSIGGQNYAPPRWLGVTVGFRY